jgi:hypothetical protein
MNLCGVVEVTDSADAVGSLCPRTADCGAELCDEHAETCGMCRAIFCPSCLSLHLADHPKPAPAEHGQSERKIA